MKKFLLVLPVIGLAFSSLAEERLIVTSEGQSFWVTSISQEGQTITYTSKATGETKSVPLSSLHGTVPRVVRGTKYEADEVKTYIARIKMLQGKHKSLYRQLETLLQEWQALQKPSTELISEIDELKQAFDSSDKGTAAYRRAVRGLGMVQYKDAAGNCKVKIESALAQIKDDYIKTSTSWLDAHAATAETMLFNDFVAFEQLTKDVSREIDADARGRLLATLEATRLKVLNGQSKAANNTFIAAKSIDSYLDAMRILLGLKEIVANDEKQKALLDGQIASLVEMVAKSNPGYKIDESGFPLDSTTSRMIAAQPNGCSRGTSGNDDLSEQIFIVPETSIDGLRFGRPFSIPLRLVTQRAQPPDRKFALIISYPGAGRLIHDTGALQFKAGISQCLFNEKFTDLTGRQLQPSEDGRFYFYFHLAYKDKAADDEEWHAISKTCFWNISP